MSEKCTRGDCSVCVDAIVPVYVIRNSDRTSVKPVQEGTQYLDSLSDKSLLPF